MFILFFKHSMNHFVVALTGSVQQLYLHFTLLYSTKKFAKFTKFFPSTPTAKKQVVQNISQSCEYCGLADLVTCCVSFRCLLCLGLTNIWSLVAIEPQSLDVPHGRTR
jgi:hypothetical protein